ncbi:hypothetical protein [Helicobacter vulpis]|uniref:hypothetical protein n=1 Tax=Helicobacter vulpis TaxID=2316076 RepID=UPI000EB30BBB|nr:hypothetical protein [Helicobacter vulpis]
MELTPEEQAALEAHEQHILELASNPQECDLGCCQADLYYALIQDNQIADIFKGESLPQFNPKDIQLIALPQGQERHYKIGGRVQEGKLVPMSLEEAKATQLAYINLAFEAAFNAAQSEHVPLEESMSYELQYQEAQLFNTDPSKPTPFLDALALARKETKSALAAKILSKHQAYFSKLATLMGYTQTLRNNLAKAQDLQEVFQVEFKNPLE